MCGRFAFFSPREAVSQLFGVDFPLALEPRYNITPSSFVVGLRATAEGGIEPAVLKWGLIPSWAKDPSIGNRMINARAETAHEKPSFRAAFRRRRCVILADGFFEWQQAADGKQPYYITRESSEPFAMAGLWEHWQASDGSEVQTCTILTTAANELLSSLHHRMPVLVAPDRVPDWVGPEADQRSVALEFLANPDNDDLSFRPVSRAVNSPRNDGPELILDA